MDEVEDRIRSAISTGIAKFRLERPDVIVSDDAVDILTGFVDNDFMITTLGENRLAEIAQYTDQFLIRIAEAYSEIMPNVTKKNFSIIQEEPWTPDSVVIDLSSLRKGAHHALVHDLSILQTGMNDSDAIDDVSNYIGVVQGLATGALVFSVGLLSTPLTFPAGGRRELIWGWSLLLVSIFFSILARGAVVSQKENKDLNTRTGPLLLTVGSMVMAFFAACVLIGLSVISSIKELPFVETYLVRTPSDAVKTASNAKAFVLCRALYDVKGVKAIDGLEKPQDDGWEVTFTRNDVPLTKWSRHCTKRELKVFIDAKSGESF